MAVAPSPRALITLDEYKRYKDPGNDPAAQDTYTDDHFQVLINAIGDIYRRYCLTPLIYEQTAEPESHDGDDVQTIRLNWEPVVIDASHPFVLTEDRGFGPVALNLNEHYRVRKETAEVVRISGLLPWYWAPGVQNIAATYWAGRWADTDAVDWDMKLWAMQGVDWLHGLGPATWGRTLDAVGGTLRPDEIPAPIKRALNQYKVKRV